MTVWQGPECRKYEEGGGMGENRRKETQGGSKTVKKKEKKSQESRQRAECRRRTLVRMIKPGVQMEQDLRACQIPAIFHFIPSKSQYLLKSALNPPD